MLKNGMYDKYKSENTDSIPVDDVKLMSYHIQQLVSEIGEVLNKSENWARVTYYRGKEKLRKELDNDEE